MTPVEMIEAEVLCARGGIAGLMAAIRAAELGTGVFVEKEECVGCGKCVDVCSVENPNADDGLQQVTSR